MMCSRTDGDGYSQRSSFGEADGTRNFEGRGSRGGSIGKDIRARSSVTSTGASSGGSGSPAGSTRDSLGQIDPRLYKRAGVTDDDDEDDEEFPEGHIGRISFSVQYMREAEKLVVTVFDARNLPRRRGGSVAGGGGGGSNGGGAGGGFACDPFVKICLLPDTRSNVQSKYRKKSCNPKFEESFVFPVSSKTLEQRVLKLTVYDVDRLRRHNIIGHVLYPIKGHDHESNKKISLDLEREITDSTSGVDSSGEINVALTYNERIERLSVGVFEAKNLLKCTEQSSPDFYVKICLMRHGSVVKTKRTDVIKRDACPKFNESFVFKLSADELDKSSYSVTVWQSLSGQKDKAVGRVVFGSYMFARGRELEHWNEMLANPREQISRWHSLV